MKFTHLKVEKNSKTPQKSRFPKVRFEIGTKMVKPKDWTLEDEIREEIRFERKNSLMYRSSDSQVPPNLRLWKLFGRKGGGWTVSSFFILTR